jgi:hypothetical protein
MVGIGVVEVAVWCVAYRVPRPRTHGREDARPARKGDGRGPAIAAPVVALPPSTRPLSAFGLSPECDARNLWRQRNAVVSCASQRDAAFAVLTSPIRDPACTPYLSFMRGCVSGVFVNALKVRFQALQW